MIIINDNQFIITDSAGAPIVRDAEFIRSHDDSQARFFQLADQHAEEAAEQGATWREIRSAGADDALAAVERNMAAGLPPLHGLVSEVAPKPW